MPLTDCFKLLRPDDRDAIMRLADKHKDLTRKEAVKKAVREYSDVVVRALDGIHKQLVQEKPAFTEPVQTEIVKEPVTIPDQVQNVTKQPKVSPEGYKEGDHVSYESPSGAENRSGTIKGFENGKYIIEDANGRTVRIKPEKVNVPEEAPAYTGSMEDLNKAIDNLEPNFKKRTESKSVSGIVPMNLNPWVIVKSAWGAFNKGQELTFGAAFKGLEGVVARKINNGVNHRSAAVRTAAQTLRNLIGGLPYSEGDLTNKLQFNGNKNWAHLRGKLLAEQWYKIIDTDFASLSRVHAALDPKTYAKNPLLSNVTYNSLNASEKALFDSLRAANDFIHEWSFRNNFISKATYDERKGTYIGKFYEDFELPDDLRENMKSSRADFHMFKQRKDGVTLDVLEDPVYATAKRMTQIMQNQAIFDYAKQITASKDIKTSDTEFPGSIQLGKPGDKPFYGELTGKYVPQYIAEDFKGFFYTNSLMQSAFDTVKKYDKWWLRQFLKKSHTVYDPIVQLGNATANISFAFWAGVDPVTFLANMVPAAKELKTRGPVFVEAVKAGLIGADIMSGDLVPAKAKNERTGLAGLYDKFNRVASGAYSGTDDISKLSAYISLKNNGYTAEQAAKKVYEGFQNYATVGKSYDLASKTPVVGNAYIKFKADLGRIMKNAITQRPLTAALYLGMLYTIKEWLSDKAGEDDDVKKVREGRNFIPKIWTPAGSIPLVWQVPGVGEVNFARFISPYYQYDTGKSTTLGEVSDWLPYQMDWEPGVTSKDTPVIWVDMPDVLLGVYAQIAFDKDFRGKSIADPQGSGHGTVAVEDNEKWINRLNYASRSQIPFYRNVDDMVAAWTGKPDAYNRVRSVQQAALNNFIKVQQFGSDEAKNYLIREYEHLGNKIGDIENDITFLNNTYEKEVAAVDKLQGRSDEAKDKLKKEALEKLMRRVGIKVDEHQAIEKQMQEPQKMLLKFKEKFGRK